MPIIQNQPNGKLVVSRTGAGTDTINLADGNVAGTTAPTTGYVISKILWSGTGALTIARGANTYYTLAGTGEWDLSAMGIADARDATATVVITTAAGGSAIVELKKLPNNRRGE